MAHWNFKTVKGKKYLFVYTYENGKQVQVKPRSEYSHLDGASEASIQAWVDNWSIQWEHSRVTKDNILFSDDKLNTYLKDYIKHLQIVKKRSQGTRDKYKSLIERYAFQFFLSKGLKDPQQWPGVSIQMFPYLRDGDDKATPPRSTCSQSLIHEINNAFRGFFNWMQEEGIVAWQGAIKLRNTPKVVKETPLEFALTPQQVLKFVQDTDNRDVKFLALAGYFFSLRPQETFALRASDFRAGEIATKLECTKAMRKIRLFGEFAVYIDRQQDAYGEPQPPKAYSKGWVACFNKKAAELMIELLNDLDDVDAQILGTDNRAIYRKWERGTEETELASIDLKDLRRASVYWLGHHSTITVVQLQKHARHKDIDTTQMYMRRPAESVDDKPKPGKFKLVERRKSRPQKSSAA